MQYPMLLLFNTQIGSIVQQNWTIVLNLGFHFQGNTKESIGLPFKP